MLLSAQLRGPQLRYVHVFRSSTGVCGHLRHKVKSQAQSWLHGGRQARPSLDDVENISRGKNAKHRGTGSRAIAHRMDAIERESYEVAKRRGYLLVHGSGWRRQRKASPLLHSYSLWCDATKRPCISVHRLATGSRGYPRELRQPRYGSCLKIDDRVSTSVNLVEAVVVVDVSTLRLPYLELQEVANRLEGLVHQSSWRMCESELTQARRDGNPLPTYGRSRRGSKCLSTWKLEPRRLECSVSCLKQAKRMAMKISQTVHVWSTT
eukprot:SAG31_NODE_695_length_12765_cov_6.974499_7_plen_265_part_00